MLGIVRSMITGAQVSTSMSMGRVNSKIVLFTITLLWALRSSKMGNRVFCNVLFIIMGMLVLLSLSTGVASLKTARSTPTPNPVLASHRRAGQSCDAAQYNRMGMQVSISTRVVKVHLRTAISQTIKDSVLSSLVTVIQ